MLDKQSGNETIDHQRTADDASARVNPTYKEWCSYIIHNCIDDNTIGCYQMTSPITVLAVLHRILHCHFTIV